MDRVREAGGIVVRCGDAGPEVLLVRPLGSEVGWIFPKGHVEAGESAGEAALREVREEGGIVGAAIAILEPSLEFESKGEPVIVRYHLIQAVGAVTPKENRNPLWFPMATALSELSHEDARKLLSSAAPLIEQWCVRERQEETGNFNEYMLAEYSHTAESLLRSEEEGEKRVGTFLSLAAGVGAVMVFVRGDDRQYKPEEFDALILVTLGVLLLLGLITLARVITRNAASDTYIERLNRVRRYFIRRSDDPRRPFLAFDPWEKKKPRKWSTFSLGKGGWLEIIAFVDAVLAGSIAAVVVPSPTWLIEIVVGALSAIVAWIGIIKMANRLYQARIGAESGSSQTDQPLR